MKPTDTEIRIAAVVCWDVRENFRDWDDAITRAAAALDVSRAAIAECVHRTRAWLGS